MGLHNRSLEFVRPAHAPAKRAKLVSAPRAAAEVLFAGKVRGQTTVLRFVNRRRNNAEIRPEHAAEVR